MSADNTPLLPNDHTINDGDGPVQETDQSQRNGNHQVLVTAPSNTTSSPLAPPTPPTSSLNDQLVKFNTLLSYDQVYMFGLALSTQKIAIMSSIEESLKFFTDFFNLLEQQLGSQAVSFTVQVLRSLGVAKNDLDAMQQHVDHVFNMRNDFLLDLFLTVADIVLNMSNEVYCSFVDLVRRAYLRGYHPDRFRKRVYFMQILLQRDLLNEANLTKYFQWVSTARCTNQLKKLSEFCERHNIQEPDWYSEVEPQTAPTKPSVDFADITESSMSLPNSQIVNRDGRNTSGDNPLNKPHQESGLGSNNASLLEDRTETSQHQEDLPITPQDTFMEPNGLPTSQSVNPSRGVTSGDVRQFNKPSGESEQGSNNVSLLDNTTDRTETYWEDMPITQEDTHGNSGVLVTQNPRNPGSPPFPQGERKADERSSLVSDPHDDTHNYGTLSSMPTASQPIGIPQNSQLLSLTQGDGNTRQTALPILESTPTRGTVHDESPGKHNIKSRRTVWCCVAVIVGLLVSLVLLGVWLGYLDKNHLLLFTPPVTQACIGSSSTSKLGCYDPSKTRSVHVKEGVAGGMSLYDSTLYKVKQSDLRIKETSLTNVSRSFEETSGGLVVPVNYLYDSDPVYVASTGTLAYTLVSINHGSSAASGTMCHFQFFLFSSKKNYNHFVGSSDITQPSHYYRSSKCMHAGSAPTSDGFNFDLPSEGLYYVAAYIADGIEVNVTMSGYLTDYNIANGTAEQCSLNDEDTDCTIVINTDPGVPKISQEHECILSRSRVEQCSSVNITVTTVGIDGTGTILAVSWPLPLIIIGVIVLFCCIMYCRRRTRRSNV